MFPSLPSSIDYCLIASIESGGDISQRGREWERKTWGWGWLHISVGGSLDNPAEDQQTGLSDLVWARLSSLVCMSPMFCSPPPAAVVKVRIAGYCVLFFHESQLQRWFMLPCGSFSTIITSNSDTCLCLILPDSFSANDKVVQNIRPNICYNNIFLPYYCMLSF